MAVPLISGRESFDLTLGQRVVVDSDVVNETVKTTARPLGVLADQHVSPVRCNAAVPRPGRIQLSVDKHFHSAAVVNSGYVMPLAEADWRRAVRERLLLRVIEREMKSLLLLNHG